MKELPLHRITPFQEVEQQRALLRQLVNVSILKPITDPELLKEIEKFRLRGF